MMRELTDGYLTRMSRWDKDQMRELGREVDAERVRRGGTIGPAGQD
jgi:hypothetical protein